MPFGHLPILTSVKDSTPTSGHSPSFLASGEIWGHTPTREGLQTLSSPIPGDRGTNRPREA